MVGVNLDTELTITEPGCIGQEEAGAADPETTPIVAWCDVRHFVGRVVVLKKRSKLGPIGDISLCPVVQWPAIGRTGRPYDPTTPVVRFGDDIEPRSGRRVADSQCLDLDGKEV